MDGLESPSGFQIQEAKRQLIPVSWPAVPNCVLKYISVCFGMSFMPDGRGSPQKVSSATASKISPSLETWYFSLTDEPVDGCVARLAPLHPSSVSGLVKLTLYKSFANTSSL